MKKAKKEKKTKSKTKISNNSQVSHYMFKTIVTLFVVLFFAFFIIVMSSPRQDLQKRGFIQCTEIMAAELHVCQSKAWCSIKSILKNSFCDSKVITKGFGDWLKGEQKTPWANYIFEAEIEENFEEALKQFYEENPNVVEEMQKLKESHKELENGTSKIKE